MTRREMREHCFKMLFCVDFYPADETAQQIEQYFSSPSEDEMIPGGGTEILHKAEVKPEDETFLKTRVEKMVIRVPELDERINQVAKGWKTGRMGKAELTILRLALFEILYDEDIPNKVAINEAVDLAKKFGEVDAPAFINGVLAKLLETE